MQKPKKNKYIEVKIGRKTGKKKLVQTAWGKFVAALDALSEVTLMESWKAAVDKKKWN